MTTGMTAPTLHTAAVAAAGGGVRVFGLPWWFPLVLLLLMAVVVLLAVNVLQRRYARAAAALSAAVLLGWALLAPTGFGDFFGHLPWTGRVG